MKKLKQLVRDIIDPDRHLGHIDRGVTGKKPGPNLEENSPSLSSGNNLLENAKEMANGIVKQTPGSIFEASKDGPELTLSIDADAAGAKVASSKESGYQEARIEISPETCEDCN